MSNTVTLTTTQTVSTTDVVNLVFGSGLYTLPWWGGIGFHDKNGLVSWDDVDNNNFDQDTLGFIVEAWQDPIETNWKNDTDETQFRSYNISLGKLVEVANRNPDLALALAQEDMDVVSADRLLQIAVYGLPVWG